jgi:ribonuclease R
VTTRSDADAPAPTVEGRFLRHRIGYGFVLPDDGGSDLYVHESNQGEAIHRDRVRVRSLGPGLRGRREGAIVSVIEEARRPLLGRLRLGRRGGTVEPFEEGYGFSVEVARAELGAARDGEAVGVELRGRPRPGHPARGRVVERLGLPDEPGADVRIIVRKYGFAEEFPEDVRREAEALAVDPSADGRTDFTGEPVVTIDGESARDFDDAVTVVPLPEGGWRLTVHIADVSHFVAPGSALEVEARRRGTSVYFPDRAIPMLPERLSNDLCSLRPDELRLVQSVALDVGPRGGVRSARFHDGVIRSRARLTYTEVARIVEERDPGARKAARTLTPMLDDAAACARALRARRLRRGALDFDLPEPEILLDLRGNIADIVARPRNEAHRMIEEFMLAANEAVAAWMVDKGLPTLFRIHEPPDPARLEALDEDLAGFGYRLPQTFDAVRPEHLQELLRWVEGRPEASLLTRKVLRTMALARYDPWCRGHFGLAATAYLHFTSPIRRYPDLVAHRHLREARRGRAPRTEKARDGRRAALGPLAAETSRLERDAEAAERESVDTLTLSYLSRRLGEELDGVVSQVAPIGVFVLLEEGWAEGLVPIETLGSRRYRVDARRHRLAAEGGGPSFRVGDRVRVRLDRVDPFRRRVDLGLPDSPAGRGSHRPRVTEDGRGPGRRRGKTAGRRGARRRRQGGRSG